jgi:hypothetical protein
MGLVINGQKYEKAGKISEKEWTNKFLEWGVNGGTLFNLTSGATDPQVRQAVEKNIKKLGGDAANKIWFQPGTVDSYFNNFWNMDAGNSYRFRYCSKSC